MRFSTRYPRHLSARSPRERGTVLGQFLLIAITIVIGGLLAMAVTRHGEPAATETPAAPEAQPRPTSPPPTAGTPATAPAASAPAGGTPASSGTPAVGGGNLLANPGFEEGLDGWTAIGGAKLDLANESREGSLALSLTAGGGRAPGVSARHVTESEAHRSYSAIAWIRTARAGTTAELNLVEYVGQRRLSTDTSGAVLPDMTCTGINAAGTDMPKSATLRLELVDEDNNTTLARQNVTTSPAGTFKTTVRAHLNQVASIRLTVATADGRQLAFADHAMDRDMPMCSLPFTGASDSTPLLYGSVALMALGAIAFALAAWRLRKPAPGQDRA